MTIDVLPLERINIKAQIPHRAYDMLKSITLAKSLAYHIHSKKMELNFDQTHFFFQIQIEVIIILKTFFSRFC